MPKMSYAQEVAALEETLAALRVRADVVPPLALAVGEDLAAQIARIKELKRQQRAYAAEGKATTEALHAEMACGMVHAHNIRTYVVLLYGAKSQRITRFGLRVRRRPRRKAAAPPEITRDAAWTAHAARANVAEIGGEALERGAEAGWDGGDASRIGGNAPGGRAEAPGIGAFPPGIGASAPGGGGGAPKFGEKPEILGQSFPRIKELRVRRPDGARKPEGQGQQGLQGQQGRQGLGAVFCPWGPCRPCCLWSPLYTR